MSEVGIVSIAIGTLMVITRAPLVVAPVATVRWFKRVVGTDARVRRIGALSLLLGVAMVWAGASEASVLATVLSWLGWIVLLIATPLLLLFPAGYRLLVEGILDDGTDLFLRLLGLLGVFAGLLLIYFGVLAL